MTLAEFRAVYLAELQQTPGLMKSPEVTADNMIRALQAGSYNKDGKALKKVLTACGVRPYTYRQIDAFVKELAA